MTTDAWHGADSPLRVLLSVGRKRDHEMLVGLFEELQGTYEVVTADEDDDPFDLCLVDTATYAGVRDRLTALKTDTGGSSPSVLLLVSPGELADGVLAELSSGPVDDVLVTPVAREVLAARLRTIFEAGRVSRRLEDERTRFVALAENAPDAILVVDTDGEIQYANPATKDVFGYSPELLEGESLPPLFTDASKPVLDGALSGNGETIALDGANAVEGTVSGRHADGHSVPLELSFGAFEHGADRLFVCLFRDVTERVEREQELAASEERFRAVFEGASDAILIADDTGAYVEANPAAAELFGLPREELLGMTAMDFAPPDYDFGAASEGFRRGEYVEGEFPLVRPDGTRRITEFSATPNILPRRHLSVLRDVTERVERDRDRERYELIVQTTPDYIYTVDPSGNLALANDAVATFTDRPVEHIVGSSLGQVFGYDHADTLGSLVTKLLASGETEGTAETSVTADGVEHTFRTRVSIKPMDEGEYRGYVCVTHDISELRERERRMSVLDRVLRHNIRNKLNVVSGHAGDLLREDSSEDDIEFHARAILTASDALNGFSEVARRFRSTLDPDEAEVLPRDLAVHARNAVAEMLVNYPAATIETSLDDDAWVEGPRTLELALDELVENAIIHCDREPVVRVTVTDRPDEGVVEVRVADNGPGFDPVERRALEQGRETPLQHMSGLGLWFVRWTVTTWNGTLEITDDDPWGSVVILRFPRIDPPDDAPFDGRR